MRLERVPGVLVLFIAISLFGFQAGSEKGNQEEIREGQNVLWTDPGDVASFDFEYGIGGSERQPEPPFQFIDEDLSGTSSKVNVTDAHGTKWNVKWGREPYPSTFCTRLLAAIGYYAETEYFLARGRINGIHRLTRAHSKVSKDGSFVNARFQLRSDSPKYLPGQHWTWANNPFVGTRQLQGLKILLLLVSNWDTKEANLSIFKDDSGGAPRYFYGVDDWGASLGKWGNTFTWTKWDCKGFAEQTPHFVKRVENGSLKWGFQGKNERVVTDITIQDVQWLLKYLDQVTDEQIRAGLAASGAMPDKVTCFGEALRQRIQQLKEVSADIAH